MFGCKVTWSLAAPAVLAIFATTANAQTQLPPLVRAVSGSGGSTLQVGTAISVQTVCGALGAAGHGANRLAERAPLTRQEDLYFRCNEMVENANAVNGSGNTNNTLGLSGPELARAMQQLAGEENGSQTRLATETSNGQFANIGLRLDALSRGARATAGGGATAGRQLDAVGGNAAADGEGGGWGWFVNGAVGFGERDASSDEDSYEYDSNGITFGADYQLGGGAVLGTALGLANFEVDFDDLSAGTLAATGSGGGIEVEGYSLSFFGLAQPTARLSIDGILTYGQNDYDMQRRVFYRAGTGATGHGAALGTMDRMMLGSTDSDQLAAEFSVGTSFNWGATSLYLDGGISYLDIDVAAYAEVDPLPTGGLNLAFDEQNIRSRQARLAAHLTRAFNTNAGVISPYIQLELRREYENDPTILTSHYVNALAGSPALSFRTDAPDEEFIEADIGIVFLRRNNFQFVIDYRTSVGLDLVDANLVTFNFRGGF